MTCGLDIKVDLKFIHEQENFKIEGSAGEQRSGPGNMGTHRFASFVLLLFIPLASPSGRPAAPRLARLTNSKGPLLPCHGAEQGQRRRSGELQMASDRSVREARVRWENSSRMEASKAPDIGADVAGMVFHNPELLLLRSFSFEAAAWTMWGIEVPDPPAWYWVLFPANSSTTQGLAHVLSR